MTEKNETTSRPEMIKLTDHELACLLGLLECEATDHFGSDFAINALTLPSVSSLEALRLVEKVSTKVSLTVTGRSFISDYLFKTFNQTTVLFRARNMAKGNKSVEQGNKESLSAGDPAKKICTNHTGRAK